MTLLGAKDRDNSYSYQNIADIIRQYSSDPKADMVELWRRIVFSVLISNTDDHLRNHGFLRINDKGWRLSPVYDVNPSSDNTSSLSTMISEGDYSATLENALSVAEYFEVSSERADKIISEVKNAVSNWRAVAKQWGISQAEINQMEVAFKK
jgi:serine/threonine-protein kinase HipA